MQGAGGWVPGKGHSVLLAMSVPAEVQAFFSIPQLRVDAADRRLDAFGSGSLIRRDFREAFAVICHFCKGRGYLINPRRAGVHRCGQPEA